VENFGRIVLEQRKKLQISQKDLAASIRKEDGSSISPQYLNDIERGRRNPPPEYIIKQLAEKLNLTEDYLFYLAGKLPDDIEGDFSSERVEAAMKLFRRTLHEDK
jgi:transcriptional regulator with XRE-family HTH domain